MRRLFLTVAVVVCLAVSYALVRASAQPANEPKLVVTDKNKPKPDMPGLDCVQSAYTRVRIDQMASCPADKPLINGIMFSVDTDLSPRAGGEAEWSFNCCKIKTAEAK